MRITNETRQRVLAEQVILANNIFTRLRGLLFRPILKPDHGLLLVPCKAIHCIGMSYEIDAIFFSKQYLVVGLVQALKPGHFSAVYTAAHSCLELPEGVIANTGTQIGDCLSIYNQ